jgi:hypothetical protein
VAFFLLHIFILGESISSALPFPSGLKFLQLFLSQWLEISAPFPLLNGMKHFGLLPFPLREGAGVR